MKIFPVFYSYQFGLLSENFGFKGSGTHEFVYFNHKIQFVDVEVQLLPIK